MSTEQKEKVTELLDRIIDSRNELLNAYHSLSIKDKIQYADKVKGTLENFDQQFKEIANL